MLTPLLAFVLASSEFRPIPKGFAIVGLSGTTPVLKRLPREEPQSDPEGYIVIGEKWVVNDSGHVWGWNPQTKSVLLLNRPGVSIAIDGLVHLVDDQSIWVAPSEDAGRVPYLWRYSSSKPTEPPEKWPRPEGYYFRIAGSRPDGSLLMVVSGKRPNVYSGIPGDWLPFELPSPQQFSPMGYSTEGEMIGGTYAWWDVDPDMLAQGEFAHPETHMVMPQTPAYVVGSKLVRLKMPPDLVATASKHEAESYGCKIIAKSGKRFIVEADVIYNVGYDRQTAAYLFNGSGWELLTDSPVPGRESWNSTVHIDRSKETYLVQRYGKYRVATLKSSDSKIY